MYRQNQSLKVIDFERKVKIAFSLFVTLAIQDESIRVSLNQLTAN